MALVHWHAACAGCMHVPGVSKCGHFESMASLDETVLVFDCAKVLRLFYLIACMLPHTFNLHGWIRFDFAIG